MINLRLILGAVGALDWFEQMFHDLGDDEFRMAECQPIVGNVTWYVTGDGETQSTMGSEVVTRGIVLRWRPQPGSKTSVIAFPPDEEDSGRPWRAWPLAVMPEEIRTKLVAAVRATGPKYASYDLPALPATEWDYNWESKTPAIDVTFTKHVFRKGSRVFTELRAWYEGKRIEPYKGGKRGIGASRAIPDRFVREFGDDHKMIRPGVSLRCTVHRGREGLNRILVIWQGVTTEEAKAAEAEQNLLQLGGTITRESAAIELDWFALLGLDSATADFDAVSDARDERRSPPTSGPDPVLETMTAAGVPAKDRDAILARAVNRCRDAIRARDRSRPKADATKAETPESKKPKVLLPDVFAALGLTAETADLDKVNDAREELLELVPSTDADIAADTVLIQAIAGYTAAGVEVPSREQLLKERPSWINRAAKVCRGKLHSKARGETVVASEGTDEATAES